MSCGKIITLTTVILGGVLGAGFVGGKEIVLFFGESNFFAPILFTALFCAALIVIAIYCHRKNVSSISEMAADLFGKFAPLYEMLTLAACFIVTSTMLAGANDCFSAAIGNCGNLPVYSYLTALLCGIALHFGIGGVKKVNVVALPLVTLFVVAASIFSKQSAAVTVGTELRLDSAYVYATFNATMIFGIFLPTASKTTKKQSIIACIAACAIILPLCLLQLKNFGGGFEDSQMPAINLVEGNIFLEIWGIIAIFLAIFTSLLGSAYPIVCYLDGVTNDITLSTMLLFLFALPASMMGFDFIVKYFYPVIAAIGTLTYVAIAIKLVKCKKASAIVTQTPFSDKNK